MVADEEIGGAHSARTSDGEREVRMLPWLLGLKDHSSWSARRHHAGEVDGSGKTRLDRSAARLGEELAEPLGRQQVTQVVAS